MEVCGGVRFVSRLIVTSDMVFFFFKLKKVIFYEK